MSIRPVDLQVLIHKSSEVHRVQAPDSHRPEVAQQQFAQQMQKELELADQQVVQSHKSEGNNVDKDGKGNSSEYKGKKKRDKRGKTEEKDNKQSLSLLDLKI